MEKWASYVERRILVVGLCFLVIGLPFVYVPRIVSELYEAERSSIIMDETLGGPRVIVSYNAFLRKGDFLNIQVTVFGGGDLFFTVSDPPVTYIDAGPITNCNENWTVPLSATYIFRYSGTGLLPSPKAATTRVTRFWTETAYRDVAKSYPMPPVESLYGGLVLILAGVGITIYGAAKREKTPVTANKT